MSDTTNKDQPDDGSDGGIVTIGDTVVYDGEAEFLKAKSKVGEKMPLPKSMQDDAKVDGPARKT
jgi:hypothetical protein